MRWLRRLRLSMIMDPLRQSSMVLRQFIQDAGVSGFDPYLIWLDIPPHERPVNYYRLFGLHPLESDSGVIAAAANRVITHVSRYQQSEHAAACTQLLAELTAARDCLLNPMRKQAYDNGFAPGAASSSSPVIERPIAQTPQMPNQAGPVQTPERQIAQTPPVPFAPPTNASMPASSNVSEQPLTLIPAGTLPIHPQPVASAEPAVPAQHPNPPTASPSAAPNPPPDQPPAWAQTQRTGEVETIIAGQGTTPSVAGGRTARGRQLRRDQQAQSAYLLVGIAMALVVFFFGAVLLLAIYLGGQ